jgi:hypothetical protein
MILAFEKHWREYNNEYLLNCNLPAEIQKNNQVRKLVSELTPSGLGEMLSSTDEAFF